MQTEVGLKKFKETKGTNYRRIPFFQIKRQQKDQRENKVKKRNTRKATYSSRKIAERDKYL